MPEELTSRPPWCLPQAANADWLVKSEINQSTILAAGNGRYVLESVSKGQVLHRSRITDGKLIGDCCCRTNSVEQLKSVLSFPELEKEQKQATNMEQLVHFAFTPSNVTERTFVYHLSSSMFSNHGDEATVARSTF